MLDDVELLRSYVTEGCEDAFRTLLDRHTGLVYSAALRQVRDPHVAEEVTQAVFVVLARKAAALNSKTILIGWLFRTTRFIAARAMRDRQLRHRREQEAAHMELIQSVGVEASWDEIAPSLDEALAALGQTDRHAVLLRFFEKKGLRDVGRSLGSSEDAAKKRVSRALEKLRAFLLRRGVVLSTATLAIVLAENSVQAAPAGLSSAALSAVMAKTGTITTLGLVKATLHAMFLAKVKAAGVAAGVLLAVIGTGVATTRLLRETHSSRFVALPLERFDGMPLTNFPAGRLWGSLPVGSHTYAGVPFQIGMRLQLHGNQDAKESRRYPASVPGIPVHQRLARLHVVQGANIAERDGTPMAALRLHYAGGTTQILYVVYGVHTRQWWHYPTEAVSAVSDTNTLVVWTGRSSDGDSKGATHRMFKTTFELPASDEPVESIDCLSLFSRSSLIILAITGEVGRGTVQHTIQPDEARFRDSVQLTVFDTAGRPLRGSRVLGWARTITGGEISLGKLDDTFFSPGVIQIDFPANSRDLHLRITARGCVPAEVTLNAAGGRRLRRQATVRLLAAESLTPAAREEAEEARAAKASVRAAYVLKREGQHAAAIPLFQQSIRQYPNHSDSYHGLAQALRESGDFLNALRNHDRAIELDSARYDLYWERGLTYLRMRAFDDAIADLEACLERNSKFTKAQIALEKAYRGKASHNTELPDSSIVNVAKQDASVE